MSELGYACPYSYTGLEGFFEILSGCLLPQSETGGWQREELPVLAYTSGEEQGLDMNSAAQLSIQALLPRPS